jgi:hypothetical protein
MKNYFYNYHNQPFGSDIFNRIREDGTPSPPDSQFIVDQVAEQMTDQLGQNLISQ